jgi:non-canonical poly(A) RNA polymerase PAPD5/7
MDLVLASNSHIKGGPRTIDFAGGARGRAQKLLFVARNKLSQRGLATQCQVITRAKVPIIKYVDQESGIKVDLSFENLSGVIAQETYAKWVAENDLLAPIVLLVKQFLVMRALSDVHTGGLGGFSIVCLVYHYLYHHQPELAKQGGILNIGKLFLGFLEFWGHKFDIATQRVVMAPVPEIVKKVSTATLLIGELLYEYWSN